MRLAPLLAGLLALPLAAETIWVEGEATASSNLTRHNWYGDVKKGLLSGGDMAHHFDGGVVGEVSYRVEVPKAGTYQFWIRANPIGSSLKYRIGDQDWQPIAVAEGMADNVNIASNDAPDLRFLCWKKVGDLTLPAGTVTVAFRMDSGNNHHGMLDCFTFTDIDFQPNSALKPGQKFGLADPGTWAFEPDPDPYTDDAVFDLRSLNEKRAGEKGYLTTTPDGEFRTGDGKPIRFWAAVTGVQDRKDLGALRSHARHLAKRGINMVRYHAEVSPQWAGAQVTDVNGDVIEKTQMLVAAMRDEGIYTTFNPYWATANVQASWGIKGQKDGSAWGLLFWDEDMQRGYKAWLKEILTRPNPHTGVPLGKDPAFAIFILQNEDSLLFWTIGTMKDRPELCDRFSAKFGEWLTAKYGGVQQAFSAWKDAPGAFMGVDDPAAGKAGFLGMWEFNPGQGGGKAARLADQLAFFTETMHSFNTEMQRYIREDLGCAMLVSAGNWRTANQNTLLDAERYSYDANDIIGCNRYTGGAHVNPTEGHKAGYLVSRGDFFTNASNLLHPRKLPISGKQVAGKPFIVPESTWTSPETYQSEGPFLVAAYSALTGVDIYYWFALGSVGWDSSINKWQSANPALMGGWPAAALLFRKGYVKRGEPAVHEERRLEDIWNLKSALIVEEEGFDPNRDSGAIPKESAVQQGVDPLAFLVGPVETVYGGDPAKSKVLDLGKYIDNGKQTVTSVTGELVLDWKTGFCRLDAPKAQGVTGFLKQAGTQKLSTVTVASTDDYATYLVVSLDDKPLASSKRILVQVTTTCRPHGWKQSPATFTADKQQLQGFRIDDTGAVPWNVAETNGSVTVANAGLRKATLLDANGYRVREVPLTRAGGGAKVDLPKDCLYLVLE